MQKQTEHNPYETRSRFVKFQEAFNLSENELKKMHGKCVLDIGSGDRGLFANVLRRKYGARVVTMDKEKRLKGGKHLLADAIAIPLAEGSVDYVFASSSAPGYLSSFEEVGSFFNEVLRVLKPGGEARIYPLLFVEGYSRHGTVDENTIVNYPDQKENFVKLLNRLSDQYHITFKITKEKNDPVFYRIILKKNKH